MSREDDLKRKAKDAQRAGDRGGEDYFNHKYRQAKSDRERDEEFKKSQSRNYNRSMGGGGFSGGGQSSSGAGHVMFLMFMFFVGFYVVTWLTSVVSAAYSFAIKVLQFILGIGLLCLGIWLVIKLYKPVIKPTIIFIWKHIIVPVTIYSVTKVIIPFIKWLYTRCLKPLAIWLYDLIANLFNKKNHQAKVYHNYQHYREDK